MARIELGDISERLELKKSLKCHSFEWYLENIYPEPWIPAQYFSLGYVSKWHKYLCSCIHSFIHSGYFYSASSSSLLLRGPPDTARILCQSFTPKRHRPLRAKDLPKVPIWRLEGV